MKKRLVLFAIVILALIGVYTLTNKREPGQTWQQRYDLGVRYLSEGNYEEAVIAFMAAIDIDPKRVETYVALADLYNIMGDVEKAIQILEQGFAATGDQSLKERLEKLQSELVEKNNETEVAVETEEETEENVTEAVIRDQWQLQENIVTMEEIHMAIESASSDSIYDENGENAINTGIRDICTGDSYETVLIKMGIKPDVVKAIVENYKNISYITHKFPDKEYAVVGRATEYSERDYYCISLYCQLLQPSAEDSNQHPTVDSIGSIWFEFDKDKLIRYEAILFND